MEYYPFCISGRHCNNCRNHQASRQAFARSLKMDKDFPCPRGFVIGESAGNIEAVVPAVKKPSVCKYRGTLLQDSSCQCGKVWECLHPNMRLADNSPGRQIGRSCGKGKCKGYVQS